MRTTGHLFPIARLAQVSGFLGRSLIVFEEGLQHANEAYNAVF